MRDVVRLKQLLKTAGSARKVSMRSGLLTCTTLLSLSTLAAAGTNITPLFSFPCPAQQFSTCPLGYAPNALIQASDGNFYGAAQLTTIGTSNPHGGTLFKITPSGQFTLLFTFTADGQGNYVNGDNPASSLIEANDGFLYGTAVEGGANNSGVLFRIGKDGKGFSVVHSFCSETNCADGAGPGDLMLGHDGHLYGTTAFGGSSDSACATYGGCGTIFRFTPAAGLTTVLALNGTTQAAFPGGLIQGADGNFYGTTGNGVFRFNLDGTFKLLTTFPKVNSFLPTSSDSGIVQAANGRLYGSLITYSINQAQFYEINPAGTSFKEFPAVGTLSVDFQISNAIQASDGNLWTAFNETSEPNGAVIAFSPGTGAIVHAFSFDGPNGSLPEASVVQGADGKLYGTSAGGGVVSGGQQASGTVWMLDAGLAAPDPVVGGFAPAGGLAGAKVMIRGNHFIGTTAVTFNGVSAAFKVLNTNFIVATVPESATAGPIAVTNAGGTRESAGTFTVLLPL